MTASQYPRVSLRAGDLLPDLAARAGDDSDAAISRTADRDLHRYYALLARALPAFAEPEASLLVDALNGIITEPHSAHLLWANVEDAQREGLAEKWGVDGLALVQRLRALTPFEALAVADAAERYWQGPYRQSDMTAALRQVGLVR